VAVYASVIAVTGTYRGAFLAAAVLALTGLLAAAGSRRTAVTTPSSAPTG
jgi:hypothetical protein